MPRTAFPSRSTTLSPAPVVAIRSGGSLVIRLRGKLDQTDCEEFERQLTQAEASDAECILIDLDGLDNLDARALHVILKASRRSARNGDRLRVTRGKGHVAGIFRLTALDQTLHFHE